ncbi:cytochrome c-type biogenesis protein [Psychromarinibacter sp. S121]|uniref:cytochrome c-type biogenesis protein n=1 Tax=Psychromarinibacter sp. S121 TaxID=3415127 RepID=UPI003C79D730
MTRRILAAVLIGVLLPFAASAVEPDEMLDDSALEARAREISKELRCVVCQNQDIDSSNAGVARDLRLLVRERLVAGESDAEVLAYVQARYGDFVLLKPPFKPETYALWLAPVVLLLIGAATMFAVLRGGPRRAGERPLTDAEDRAVAEMLGDENGDSA